MRENHALPTASSTFQLCVSVCVCVLPAVARFPPPPQLPRPSAGAKLGLPAPRPWPPSSLCAWALRCCRPLGLAATRLAPTVPTPTRTCQVGGPAQLGCGWVGGWVGGGPLPLAYPTRLPYWGGRAGCVALWEVCGRLAPPPPFPAPPGVEGWDSCYLLVTGNYNWFDARTDCYNKGAHLLSTKQTRWGQNGIVDAARSRYTGTSFYLAGRRCVCACLGGACGWRVEGGAPRVCCPRCAQE